MSRSFHPFLLAMFPVLFLFANNIEEVPASDLLMPLVVVLIGTAVLLFLARAVAKSYVKAGIITSYFLLLFFSYGHIRDIISPTGEAGLDIGRFHIGSQFILAPLWAVLFLVGVYLVIKIRKDFVRVVSYLNILAIILVIMSVLNIASFAINAPAYESKGLVAKPLSAGNPNKLPDIYYIILDTYARQDVIEEVYGYDNSGFLDYLTGKGFYVATKSQSNYVDSFPSLASSLNMTYLEGGRWEDKAVWLGALANSEVSQFLKHRGYRYVFIDGGMGAIVKEISKHTDECLVYNSDSIFRKSDFVDSLIYMSALDPFRVYLEGYFGDRDREVRLYAFDELAKIPDIIEPTFVYTHILLPHPPFIFDRDGNAPKQNILQGTGNIWQSLGHEQRYVEQLIFTNKKVSAVIDEIVSKSDIKPIIILQGDHGMRWIEEYKHCQILNAYYFPRKGNELLYETISPVNSFRVVFNLYFDTDYELLSDNM